MKKKVVSRKTKTSNGAAVTAVVLTAPSREEIERRAYELYLARGQNGGNAESDWLQAERELIEQH